MIIVVGIDLGKRTDPSAIVISEYQAIYMNMRGDYWPMGTAAPYDISWEPPPETRTLYTVRSIKSVPLGKEYLEQAKEINKITQRLYNRYPKAKIHLALDRTGVGEAPVEMVRRLISRWDPEQRLIQITGVAYTRTDKCPDVPLLLPEANVGKSYLVVRLQTILSEGLLKMPNTEGAAALVHELKEFDAKTSIDGHTKYGAFGDGKHDDIANALLLSTLGNAHDMEVRYSQGRLYT